MEEAVEAAAEEGQGNSLELRTLIDTGFLRTDGNYVHSDIIDAVLSNSHLTIHTSNNSVCSGLDSICSNNIKYTFLNVNISKSEKVGLKFFILASTPFDAFIGLEAIKKHRLLDRFPSYIGLC